MQSTGDALSNEDFGAAVFTNLFETFVKPDLKKRVEQGRLPNPFPHASLYNIQIIFYPDGQRPLVRINDEVRAIAQITPKCGFEIAAGDPVRLNQIETIGIIGLTEEEADFGHATFLRNPEGGWTGYFDFTYYKGTARKHLEAAGQFFNAAKKCCEERHWIAFADTLYSAAELAAKASLFCLDLSGAIKKSKKHATIKAHFNVQRRIGNIDDEHSSALNRLWEFRQKARYVEEDVKFTEEDAEELLAHVGSLIAKSQYRATTFLDRVKESS
jgi:uncharacterized protein (UPF0332 family)